jgi:hypothetical protein
MHPRIHLHGIALNYLSTGTTLPFFYLLQTQWNSKLLYDSLPNMHLLVILLIHYLITKQRYTSWYILLYVLSKIRSWFSLNQIRDGKTEVAKQTERFWSTEERILKLFTSLESAVESLNYCTRSHSCYTSWNIFIVSDWKSEFIRHLLNI